ncbi:MAG: dihydrofolate reductase family protein, partial [Pseudomonadota bacterium]
MPTRPSTMPNRLLRLYPTPCVETPIEGLYLAHRVHELGNAEAPFVYANFLSSLDGRIAVEDTAQGTSYIPKHLTTEADFRLFMELHAQADCLITHGGYLRALNEGRLGNILQVGVGPENRDLAEWRIKNGLKPQPAIIVASASLDFPVHGSIGEFGQEIYIATGRKADPDRVRHWQKFGYKILFTGEGRLVQGAQLVRQLSALGFKSIYLIAGPHMLDTVIRERVLGRLYQTITHQLVGGEDIHTLLPGQMRGSEGNLALRSLYYDSVSPKGSGQFFAQFEPTD